MLSPTTKAYLQIHFAVILFGFTAILGDLIQLPAILIVWWRVLITSLSLLLFINFGKKLRTIPKNKILIFCGIGILVGLHWICFYGSIKLANASIALICMATTALFTSILEPLITKKSYSKLDIIIGALIIPGMALIVNTSSTSLHIGILVGLLAALLASIFGILNKKFIHDADFFSITFLELGTATLFISLILPWIKGISLDKMLPPELNDWIYLLVLSLICTTLAYVLALAALKELTAFTTNLVINLEPIYGIIMAIFILKEHQELTIGFYLGSSVILIAVFSSCSSVPLECNCNGGRFLQVN